MHRADRVRLAESQRPQRRSVGLPLITVNFVGRQKDWLPERRRIRAAASSPAVAPTTASTTRITASAVRIATDACSATNCCSPFASGSHPPVSCTTNRRPVHSAS
ncbi:hypothetical protein I552_6171 [Mycobacterium xenopi 3993]|nr:hypothetical protein I552_6171 [Mycobacterium xenopi 3993]